ncbi:MAG: tetraacyldisaccharide 4'-kinase [Phycisphaeraceae bacterium]|nr:tetraacyldisaccharide 4'-kinase [Phycisphaeraceae bacterium]
MNLSRLIPVLDGSDASMRASVMRGMLRCAEPVYRCAVRQRNRAFDRGSRKSLPLGRPTISVGNITTGGTGKTPLVIDLARRLEHAGILLRGYHGEDETLELRQAVGDTAQVEANPDRAAGARALLARAPQTRVLLLDDGFQHRQVQRDLDLVLIDATRPFGFDHLLPRGLLREPVENLKRADAVIVTRCDQLHPDALCELDNRVIELTGKPPIAHVSHRWSALRGEGSDDVSLDNFRGLRVVGVCGIGNPEAFERTLKQHAGRVQAMATFQDHHHYSRQQIVGIIDQAKRDFADAVVTTEKDYVKWQPLLKGVEPALPVLRPVLTMSYRHGEHALESLVRKVVGRGA